jgi:Fic family protein
MVYEGFPAFVDWVKSFDLSLVDRYAAKLEETKAGLPAELLEAAVVEIMREAAVDTGAIEGLYTTDRGFTHSVAAQVAGWQIQAAEKGEHVESTILNTVAVYEMIRQRATDDEGFIVTESWIRQLHEMICASQKTIRVYVESVKAYQDQAFEKGVYKTLPTSPTGTDGTVHDYASPEETPMEMERLIEQLRTSEFMSAHPVVQAAYAHYAFVFIHPFADGNGRVSRALASFYLFRGLGIPFVLYADSRAAYISSLEATDANKPDSLVNFVAERVIDTLIILHQKLRGSLIASAGDSLEAIEDANKMDEDNWLILLAERLLFLLVDKLSAALNNIEKPSHIGYSVRGPVRHSWNSAAPEGYTFPADNGIRVVCSNGDDISTFIYYVCIKTAHNDLPEFLVIASYNPEPLDVWLRELELSISRSLSMRLDTWAELEIRRLLEVAAQNLPD